MSRNYNYGTFGSDSKGQRLYLKVFSDTHGIRVSELEEYSKYKYNGQVTIFRFDDKGFYEFVKKLTLTQAVDQINEVSEWVAEHYPETFDDIIKHLHDDEPTEESKKDSSKRTLKLKEVA